MNKESCSVFMFVQNSYTHVQMKIDLLCVFAASSNDNL